MAEVAKVMSLTQEVRFIADALAMHGYPTFVSALRDAASELERLKALEDEQIITDLERI